MRCKGKTKSGDSCNRTAIEGQDYCFQHVKGFFNKLTYTTSEILGVKRRFLFWSVLFAIVIFIIQMDTSYRYGEILDNLKRAPDAELEVSPFLYSAAFGEYLPMTLTNTGDYTFENISIYIHLCGMENGTYDRYTLPLIPAHSERMIPMGNKKVVEIFKKGNCYPFAEEDRSYARFIISPSKMKSGAEYTSISVGCGQCLFKAKIFATIANNGASFNKTVDSYFDSPLELEGTVSRVN